MRSRRWSVDDPTHPLRVDSQTPIDAGYVGVVVFSPDGRNLASGSLDGAIRLYKISRSQVRSLSGSEHTSPPAN